MSFRSGNKHLPVRGRYSNDAGFRKWRREAVRVSDLLGFFYGKLCELVESQATPSMSCVPVSHT